MEVINKTQYHNPLSMHSLVSNLHQQCNSCDTLPTGLDPMQAKMKKKQVKSNDRNLSNSFSWSHT